YDLQSSSPCVACFQLFLRHATAPAQLYTLPLHDALPISDRGLSFRHVEVERRQRVAAVVRAAGGAGEDRRLRLRFRRRSLRSSRSEEHTSELQSPYDLVCRLLLEKKKKKKTH